MDTTEEALISLVIPYLRCEWNLTLFFEGTITVAVFLFYGISKYASNTPNMYYVMHNHAIVCK